MGEIYQKGVNEARVKANAITPGSYAGLVRTGQYDSPAECRRLSTTDC